MERARSRRLPAVPGELGPRHGFTFGSGGPLADAILVAAVGAPSHSLSCHPFLLGPPPSHPRLARPFRTRRCGRCAPRHPPRFRVPLRGGPDGAGGGPRSPGRCGGRPLGAGAGLARHQFRVLRTWGQVGWQLQGWAAVWGHQRREGEFAEDYRTWGPMVERSIAWLVASGHRRVRYRGIERNQLGLSLRVAGLNLRRLINLGLDHNGPGSWPRSRPLQPRCAGSIPLACRDDWTDRGAR